MARALFRGRHLLILDDVRDLPAARRQYALADPARLLTQQLVRARLTATESGKRILLQPAVGLRD